MNDHELSKIVGFMNDEATSGVVFKAIRDSFLKPSINKDISHLAASRIAIDLLGDAWKDLEKHRSKVMEKVDKPKNIGL